MVKINTTVLSSPLVNGESNTFFGGIFGDLTWKMESKSNVNKTLKKARLRTLAILMVYYFCVTSTSTVDPEKQHGR